MPFRKMLCHTKHDYLLPCCFRLWEETLFLLLNVTHLFSFKGKNLFKGLSSKLLFIQLKTLRTTIAFREVIVPLDTGEAAP